MRTLMGGRPVRASQHCEALRRWGAHFRDAGGATIMPVKIGDDMRESVKAGNDRTVFVDAESRAGFFN
jgi:hypothetical protein